MKKIFQFIVIITVSCQLSAVISSCTRDYYDKGEGELSYLRGDFAEAYVNGSRQVTRIVTDDGDDLTLTAPVLASVSYSRAAYRI